ncbi:MAG: endonuclease/exonuclease/phosphatase family protein [Bacillota bacterium]
MKTIRVVTFNIRHGCGTDNRVDLKRAAEVLSATGGDLMGLQEVDKYTPRSRFCHQPRRLGKLLGTYWTFGANVTWLPGIQYGNAVMSRWPLHGKNHLLPGSGEQRGLLEAVIETGGTAVSFFCTHLGLDGEERRTQAKKILEIMSGAGRPAILACDINSTRGSPEYGILTEAFREATEASGGFKTYPAGNPTHQLDFIFLSRHWQAVNALPIISGASDHLAVVAEIKPV